MQIIPFQIGPSTYNIFVVLEDDNLARMRVYDPAQLGIDKLPEKWQQMKLGTVIIGYASAKDLMQVHFLLQQGTAVAVKQALEFLSRGFVFDPKRGDTDAPYQSGLNKTPPEDSGAPH